MHNYPELKIWQQSRNMVNDLNQIHKKKYRFIESLKNLDS